jgi:methylmalonyl-CoA mutase
MTGKPIVELLRETFPASLQEDWKHAASQEIEGQNPLEKLSWKNADELTFLPYYDESNVATLNFLRSFQHRSGKGQYTNPRQWSSLAPVHVTNAVTANAQALDHLQHGADGLFFQWSEETSVDPENLLREIEWPYCALAFRFSILSHAQQLSRYISSMKYAPNTLNGAWFFDEVPDAKMLLEMEGISTQKKLYALGNYIHASTAAAEICKALVNGVKILDSIGEQKKVLNEISQQISFSLPAENNFLNTIAKLKALRLLWYQVVCAYGVTDSHPDNLHLHVRCESWVEEKFQPHGNMLAGTTSAMAAIIGGCDSLTVFPEEKNNITMHRIARNISVVLREESHLDKVADPLAGAYAVDVMTSDIAQKAWTMFQAEVQNL